MTIETKTAAQQLTLQRRAVIAAHQLQRFAENAAPITAAQAVDIDAACAALVTALSDAGFGASLPATQVILSNGVKISGVTITGTGTVFTPTVAGGALTGGVLSAS